MYQVYEDMWTHLGGYISGKTVGVVVDKPTAWLDADVGLLLLLAFNPRHCHLGHDDEDDVDHNDKRW